jgi:hypothetical protein
MIPPLDLITVRNGETIWLCAAESLAQALEIARQRGEGKYIVFSHQTKHKNVYEVTSDGQINEINPIHSMATP